MSCPNFSGVSWVSATTRFSITLSDAPCARKRAPYPAKPQQPNYAFFSFSALILIDLKKQLIQEHVLLALSTTQVLSLNHRRHCQRTAAWAAAHAFPAVACLIRRHFLCIPAHLLDLGDGLATGQRDIRPERGLVLADARRLRSLCVRMPFRCSCILNSWTFFRLTHGSDRAKFLEHGRHRVEIRAFDLRLFVASDELVTPVDGHLAAHVRCRLRERRVRVGLDALGVDVPLPSAPKAWGESTCARKSAQAPKSLFSSCDTPIEH